MMRRDFTSGLGMFVLNRGNDGLDYVVKEGGDGQGADAADDGGDGG